MSETLSMGLVPIFEIPRENDRVKSFLQKVQENFGKSPDFLVRVPGRVNLIGEHIDYCGYGVLPMAIQKDILVAVVRVEGSNELILINTDEEKYARKIIPANFSTELLGTQWYDYFCCGVRGAQEHLQLKLNGSGDFKADGMKILVDGNIPPSAGLSSSSALVSAAALTTLFAHGITPVKSEIADLCARAERYIGTQGGGMDQAIAFLATKGCAQHIEFNPIRSTEIKLPNDAVFVIAHSLVEKNKAASNDFNCRVVECRLAAQVVAKLNNVHWRSKKKIKDVQEVLGKPVEEMLGNLHEHPYTKCELAQILEISMEELEENILTSDTKLVNTFKLKQRAKHVLQEVERVKLFKKSCEGNSLVEMGKLMYESHESLKNLFEASHPKLDQYAYGCRLTGAGWGGCTVALVAADKAADYIDALKKEYYAGMDDNINVSDFDLDSLVFSSIPSPGACVYQQQQKK